MSIFLARQWRLVRRACASALCALVISQLVAWQVPPTDASSDDSISAFEQSIQSERTALQSPGLPPAQRLEGVERILKLRQSLIDSQPDDPHRGIWMADQATDLFFDLLSIDASGLTALFGVPSPAQRQRVQRVAQEMHDLAAQAEPLIRAMIFNMEQSPDFAADAAMQSRRNELIEQERDRRIPFLRGIGAVLKAELILSSGPEQTKICRFALEVLSPLHDSLEGRASVQARLYSGLARARLGEFDNAESLFEDVAKDDAAAPADVFAARMGGVINRVMRGGPQAGLRALESIEPKYAAFNSEPASLFFRLLIADQRFLLRRHLALAAPADERDLLLAQALSSYSVLLNAGLSENDNNGTRVPSDAICAIVLAKLAQVIGDDAPLDQLPPIATIARADQLARSQTTRPQAIAMLDQSLEDERLTRAERAVALYLIAQTLYEQGERLPAARRFIELAHNHPTDSRANRSIALGVAIAAELHQKNAADVEARETLHDGLALLLDRYPNIPTVDRWRYAAGRLALEEGRFDDAAALFSEVGPDASQWLDAQFMRAMVAQTRARTITDTVHRLKATEHAIAVIERTEPIIQAGLSATQDQTRSAALRYYLAWLRVFRAQAMLNLHRPQVAIDALSDIENDSTLDAAVLGEALEARINAYQELNRPNDALREIERFTQAVPDRAGAALAPVLAAMQREIEKLIQENRDDQALELAQSTLLPAARTLDRWLIGNGTTIEDQALLGRLVADAHRLGGDYEQALKWYDRLLAKHPNTLELLLGRAESLFNLGGEQRLADAMTIYKRLAAARGGGGGPEPKTETYWLANLRMLQIIDRVNRNTNQIMPRIERLRQQDPNFGSERHRRGFEALRNKHRGKL